MARLPEVATYARRHPDGVWDLTVACPFCGDAHLHGGGRDAHPDLGLCVSHCLADGLVGSYVLIAGPADMAKPRSKSRAWRVARASR